MIDEMTDEQKELIRLAVDAAFPDDPSPMTDEQRQITELTLFAADLQRQLAACNIVIADADAAIRANKDLHARLTAAAERIAGLERENGRLRLALERIEIKERSWRSYAWGEAHWALNPAK